VSPAPTTAAQRTKRLHLLDAAEIAALYDRPHFTDEERADYFALTPTEMAHMQTFTAGAVQVAEEANEERRYGGSGGRRHGCSVLPRSRAFDHPAAARIVETGGAGCTPAGP
jgi:hypothetical protein